MQITEADYARIVKRMGAPEKRSVAPCPTEAQEQEAIITWARCNVGKWPALQLLFHVPNGEERSKAAGARLKLQGVQAGVPDLCMPVARHGFYGLWIELKRADRSNHPSAAQRAWIERLQCEGYMVVVAYGAGEAIDAITRYLE